MSLHSRFLYAQGKYVHLRGIVTLGLHSLLSRLYFSPDFSQFSSLLEKLLVWWSQMERMIPGLHTFHLLKSKQTGKIGGRRRGDDRGWDGWMASPTRWTWVWASSRRWWRTGKPGVLQSAGSQRVRYDWTTEQQQQSKQEIQSSSLIWLASWLKMMLY